MITMKDLEMRNYYLVLDSSGSMGEPVSTSNTNSRWHEAEEATVALARKCAEFDADGIDVYTFNKSFQKFESSTPDKVKAIFETVGPSGGTDFVPVLKYVFDKALAAGKPATVLVITDGTPSETSGKAALAKLLVETANRLEGDSELGVSFLQIGQDPAAAAFLKKLDDELVAAGAKFDIVDTKTFDEMENLTIEQVLLAAVND